MTTAAAAAAALLVGLGWAGQAHAMDTTFMGWADFAVQMDDSTDGNANFDQGHLYLVADAHVNQSWSVFSVVEFEHLPSTSEQETVGSILLERAYIEYGKNAGRLRFGRVITPFGIRVPTHWVMLTPMLSKPPVESMGHIQNHSVGIEGHAQVVAGDMELEFTGLIHNGIETSGTDVAKDGLTGMVADVRATWASVYTVGTSIAHTGIPNHDGLGHHAAVGFADFTLPANLLLRAESVLFDPFEQDRHWAHYALATYTLHPYEQLTAGYRIAFGVTGVDMVDTTPTHTANLSWVPTSSVRVLLEYENAADISMNLDHASMDHASMDHASMDHASMDDDTVDQVQSLTLWLGTSF